MGPEDRVLKHLEFIQTTITRLAQNSFAFKGWAVTVLCGIVAISKEIDHTPLLFIGMVAGLVFWLLDATYARQERLFRALFDHVRVQPDTDYSMSTQSVRTEVDNLFKICFSPCVVGVYGPMIVVVTVLCLFKSGILNIVFGL